MVSIPDDNAIGPLETAVTTLLSVVQSHAAEPWAAALLNGSFGTLAPKVLATLAELDATATALAEARQVRANAQKPAYEKLLAFRPRCAGQAGGLVGAIPPAAYLGIDAAGDMVVTGYFQDTIQIRSQVLVNAGEGDL